MGEISPKLLIILATSFVIFHTIQAVDKTGPPNTLFQNLSDFDDRIKTLDFWQKLLPTAIRSSKRMSNQEITKNINALSKQVDIMKSHLNEKKNTGTMQLSQQLRKNPYLGGALLRIASAVKKIDELFESHVEQIVKNKDNKEELRNIVAKILNSDDKAENEIQIIYNSVYSNPFRSKVTDNNLATNLLVTLEDIDKERCDDLYTPQQFLFSIYMDIMTSEVKSLIRTALAYQIDAELKNNGSNSEQINKMATEFLSRTHSYLNTMSETFSKLPRHIRRCDPSNHVRGETYVEFERLMQGMLINADQLESFDEQWALSSCTDKCPEAHYGPLSPSKEYPIDPTVGQCQGKLVCDKEFISFDNGQACLMPEGDRRRYAWIKTELNGTLGDTKLCKSENVVKMTAHKYPLVNLPLPIPIDFYCRHCMCICHDIDKLRTIRRVSVREQITDWQSNRVIIGVRILEQDRMIRIQIKEGKLISGGKIEAETEEWVPLEYTNVATDKTIAIQNGKTVLRSLIKELDYINMDELDYRLLLNDTVAEKNSVIVGLAFRSLIDRSLKTKMLFLDVQTASFDWKTGKVEEPNKWISSRILPDAIPDLAQNTIILENLDDPQKSKNNLPELNGVPIQFSVTDLAKDFSQSVVPYFDTLEVAAKPAMPLGGIGLIYKSSPGYGGFISPRIYSLDFTDYIHYVKA